MAQIDERARSLNQPDEPDPEPEGDPEEEDVDQDEDEGVEGGEEEDGADEGQAPSPSSSRDRGAPALSAGLLLGAVLYTVAMQLIRGGTPQLKGWISAKFINVPWTPPK